HSTPRSLLSAQRGALLSEPAFPDLDPYMEIPASAGANGIVIHVRLTPKSGAEKIAGVELHGDKPVLKAHVTAPPEDGKANAALILLIARWLGVPKSKVTVAA